MLRPTIYIASRDLCLLTVRWRAAEAELTRRPSATSAEPPPPHDHHLVAVGDTEER
jgi:hypothetical protein